MSAWICSKKHIDILVCAMIGAQIIPPEEASATGALLWKENHRSVNTRYGERTRTPSYKFNSSPTIGALAAQPAVVLKLSNSYDYQTCETADYKSTRARKLVETLNLALGADAEGSIVPSTISREQYEAAPWSI